MLFDLFYPKELKEITYNLQSKNDLNRKAIHHINKYFLFFFSFSAFITGLILYKGDYIEAFIGLFLSGCFSYYVGVLPMINNVVIPYSLGERVNGKVLSAYFIKRYRQELWFIEYEYEFNSIKFKQKAEIYLKLNKGFYRPQKDENVVIYVNPKRPEKSTVFVPNEFKKHCLSKSLIERIPY